MTNKTYAYKANFFMAGKKPCFRFVFKDSEPAFLRSLDMLMRECPELEVARGSTGVTCLITLESGTSPIDISKLIADICDRSMQHHLPLDFWIDSPSCEYKQQIFHIWGFGHGEGSIHQHMINTWTGFQTFQYLKDIGGLHPETSKKVLGAMEMMANFFYEEDVSAWVGHPKHGHVSIKSSSAWISLGVPYGNACGFAFHARGSSGYTGISGNCDRPDQQLILLAGICTLWELLQTEIDRKFTA